MQPGEDGPADSGTQRGPRWRLAAALLLAAALAVAAWTLGRFVSADLIFAHYDHLRAAVADHPARSLMAFLALYALVVAASVPGASLLTLVGGLLFGWLEGGFAAAFAATLGAIALFLVARTALGGLLAQRGGPRMEKLFAGLRQDAVNYLLFMRLAPVFPFWMVNLAAAIVGVPLRAFAWTTAVGILPATFAIASAGAALGDVVSRQKQAYDACRAAARAGCGFDIGVQQVMTPGLLVALAAMGLVALAPVLLRRAGIMPQSHRTPPG